MKNIILLTLTLVFVIGCGKKDISGVYKPVENEIGQKWDFRNDGSFIYYGAFEPKNGYYFIDGDIVTLESDWISESDIKINKDKFSIEGTDLIWKANNQRLIKIK